MRKLNVLIAGSTGYIGLELLKILIRHENLNIKYLCANSSAGKKLSKFENYFKNKKLPKLIKFNKKLLKDVDVIFTALPVGEAQKISKYLLKRNTLIDLAGDFRISNSKKFTEWYKKKHKAKNLIKNSIYALPEITKNKVKNFQILSCPGCYPTSVLLPLIPLVKNDMIFLDNIVIDSKSGYSGAGRSVHKSYKNKNLYSSIKAYGISTHKHNAEIDEQLNKYTKKKIKVFFTPHISPMYRGIISTIYLKLKNNLGSKKVINKLKKFYKTEKFVKIEKFNKLLSTNDVVNTNYCKISLCKSRYKNHYIILSVIDNLIKGGSGQAVQNLNLKYNFPKYKGLI